MKLDETSVLHAVDKDMKFDAARLQSENSYRRMGSFHVHMDLAVHRLPG